MTKKSSLMALLEKHADEKGRVRAEPDELRRQLGMTNHDLTKLLWDWRAMGKLTFREDKNGGQVRVTGIELRNGTTRDEKLKPRENHELLAMAINEHFPLQPNGWREWNPSELARKAGITPRQLRDSFRFLRESGRLKQLGGGSRGERIGGIRWRGETYTPPAEETPAMPQEAVNNAVSMTVSGISQRVESVADSKAALWRIRAKQYREARDLASNPFLQFARDETLDFVVELMDEIDVLKSEVARLRVAHEMGAR